MTLKIDGVVALLTLAMAVALLSVGISLLGWPRFADYTLLTDERIGWRFLIAGGCLALAFLLEPKSSLALKVMHALALVSWVIFFFWLGDWALLMDNFSVLSYKIIVPAILLSLNLWYWLLRRKIK